MTSPAKLRVSHDRRTRPTPMLSVHLLCGRRYAGRRESESVNIYVDRYRLSEWALILALLLLTTTDWLWTLHHLSRGVDEANPVIAWILAVSGTTGFSIAKLGVSVIGCGFLLLHARFRLTRALLPIAFAAYACVTVIHVLTEAA